jgi:hypothetical protein
VADGIMTIKEFRDQHAMLSDICLVCHKPIKIMCRKFTGICSENCQKKQAGKLPDHIETEGHHASE